MPKIQINEPQVEIQAQSAPQVQMEHFTGGWKNTTEAFKVVDDTVKQFKKVRDYNEVSTAELGLRQELGQIESAAANEQDPTKIDDYRRKIDDAIGRHSSGISDQMVKQQSVDKFNLTGYSAYSSISNDFRKKSIDIGQANYLRATNQYEIDYSNANNDVDRQRIKGDWLNSLEGARQAGLFSADDIEKMKIKQTKSFDERDLMYDMQYLPDQVSNRRAQGAYSSLTNEEIQKGIDTAERIKERTIKENNVAYNKMIVENERGITNGLAAGQQFSIDEISQMIGNQEISPEFGQAFIKYQTSPDSIDNAEDKNGFAKYAENVFKASNDETMQSAIKVALEGGADGKISQPDMQFLLKYASDRGKRLTQKDPWQGFVDNTFGALTSWFKDKAPHKEDQAASEFIREMTNDPKADPVKVSNDIRKRETLNINPKITTIPSEGKIMVDRNGNKARVFPDGSYQEIK